ncbi:MAG: hypothetical protein JWP12_1171 [Bacteroidetes bacterium]|nr:hypothetical protein [Bacteroidota bacterium]
MKKLLLMTFAAMSFQHSFSQDYTITPGTEMPKDETVQTTTTFGFDSTYIFAMDINYRGKGTSYFLTKSELHRSEPLFHTELADIQDDERYEQGVVLTDKILVFTRKYDPDSKFLNLILRTYDPVTGKQEGSTIPQFSSLASDALGNKARKYYIKLSPDKSKLMIVSEFQWKDKPQEVAVDLYDTQTMKKISANKIDETFESELIVSNNYIVDNTGGVSFLFNYDVGENRGKKSLGFGRINANESKCKMMSLSIEDEMKTAQIELSDYRLDVADNNNVIIGGVYMDVLSREDKKADKISNEGIFTFFINTEKLSITTKNLDYFNDDVKTKLTYTDGLIKKLPSQKAYKYYGAHTVNGIVYLVFTQHYYSTEGQELEKEILVSRYTSGKQSWLRIIPRTSSSAGSFSYLFSANGFYAFYDDKTECLQSNTVEKYDTKCYNYVASFKPVPCTAVYTYISPDGKIIRKERNAADGWYTYKTLSYEDDAKRNTAYMKMIKPEGKMIKFGATTPYDFIKVIRYDMIKVK